MRQHGPIILIDDDLDDQEIMQEVLRGLNIHNPLLFFKNGKDAETYLRTTPHLPFLILCDINIPEVNGLEFKKQIDADEELRNKSIPFVFFSTSTSQNDIQEAYTQMTVQGFFKKEHSLTELKKTLTAIMEYWRLCKHPNSLFN